MIAYSAYSKTVRIQHIILFLYSEFHEENLNHQETNGEWTQNDKIKHTDNWSILVLSLSQHLRGETWRCDDNGCRPPASSWEKPSLVFWECRTSLLCRDCTFLSLEGREPPCRAPSISRRRWSPWPWAPRCGCSTWSRPSCWGWFQATVVETTVDGEQKVETYVRVSAPPWKKRYSGHKSSFTNPNKKGETKLSTHIWELKARGSTFDVK